MKAKKFCQRVRQNGSVGDNDGPPLIIEGPIEDLHGKPFDGPVHLTNLDFHERVDLSRCNFRHSLQIKSCTFRAGLLLADTRVRGVCLLRGCRFMSPPEKSLDWGRLRVGGLFDASSIVTDACIDLENLHAGDDVWFNLPRERDPQFALR